MYFGDQATKHSFWLQKPSVGAAKPLMSEASEYRVPKVIGGIPVGPFFFIYCGYGMMQSWINCQVKLILIIS